MKIYLICIILVMPFSANTQNTIQLSAHSSIGISYLRTKYESTRIQPISYPFALYSNPRFSYAIGLGADLNINKTFSLSLTSGLNRIGYTYKIYDYEEKPFERVRYERFDIKTDVAIKNFIFSEREQQKKKKKKRRRSKKKPKKDNSIHPYLLTGYSFSYKISDSYIYDEDTADDLWDRHRKLLHGLLLGGGIRRSRFECAVQFRLDTRGVLPDFGAKFLMRQVGVSTAYSFN